MNAIKVRVTREHIQRGARGVPSRCPVAYAVRSEGFADVVVLDGTVDWFDPKFHCVTQPRAVRRFIARFDAGKPVKPFTFMLRTEPPP